jgi:hypothetical protein
MPNKQNDSVVYSTTGPSIQNAIKEDLFYNNTVPFAMNASTTVFAGTGLTGPTGA